MKTVKKLGNNQYYFYADNKIVFQSYDTIVCVIENYEDRNNRVIKITDGQPQSKTTAKYLNMFLQLTAGIENYKQLNK